MANKPLEYKVEATLNGMPESHFYTNYTNALQQYYRLKADYRASRCQLFIEGKLMKSFVQTENIMQEVDHA